jgi:hypothetical protein
MPIVVLLESKRRWELLEVLARELGYGDNDNGLKELLLEHIAGIEAAVVPLYFSKEDDQKDDDEADDGGKQKLSSYDHGAEVRAFIDRMLGRNSFKESNRLQMVLHLLQRLAVEPFGHYTHLVDRVTWVESLGYIGSCGQMDTEVLLHNLNFLEVLLWVQWQFAAAVAGELGPRRRLFRVLRFVVGQLGDADLMQSAILHTVLRMLVNVLLENSDGGSSGSGGDSGSGLRLSAALMLESVCTTCIQVMTQTASSASGGKKGKGKGAKGHKAAVPTGPNALRVHMPMLITALLHKCLHHLERRVLQGGRAANMSETEEKGEICASEDEDEDDEDKGVAATADAAALRAENQCVQVSMRVLSLLLSSTEGTTGRARSHLDYIGLFVGEFINRAAPLAVLVRHQNAATAVAGLRLQNSRGTGESTLAAPSKQKQQASGAGSNAAAEATAAMADAPNALMSASDLLMIEQLLELMQGLGSSSSFLLHLASPYNNGKGPLRRRSSRASADGVISIDDGSDDGMGDDTGEGSGRLPSSGGNNGSGGAAPDLAVTAALVRSFVSAMSGSKNAIAIGRMTRLAKRSALATLRQHLLLLQAGGGGKASGGKDGKRWSVGSCFTPERAAELIGTLGELCGEVNGTDEEVRLLAAQCLGELGAVDPCEVDLTCGSGDGGNGVVFGDGSNGDEGSEAAAASQRQDPMVGCTAGMLHLLAGYIADDDAEVAWVAALVVKATLTSPAGQITYNNSSQEVIDFLQPFEKNKTQHSFKGEVSFDALHGAVDGTRPGLTGAGAGGKNSSQDGVAGNEDDAGAVDTDDIWAEENAGLWRVRAGEYDAWICALSARMATSAGQCHRDEHGDDGTGEYGGRDADDAAAQSHGGVLGASAALCALKADFAAHVFPFLAYEVIMQSNRQQRGQSSQAEANATTLARRLTDLLRETDCVEATRLVVRTVNFLREQQLTYFLEHHSTAAASSSSSSRSKKRRRSVPTDSDVAAENVGMGGVGIEIDPFVVAKAAMRGGMPYTALLFVEYHREQQAKAKSDAAASRGSRGRASDKADELVASNGSNSILLHMGYDDVSDFVDLLLQIYQHVNDPDSIYGVQRGSSLRSQIAAYRHEGDWLKSLSAYDTLLDPAGVGLQYQHPRQQQPAPLSQQSLSQQSAQGGLSQSLSQHQTQQQWARQQHQQQLQQLRLSSSDHTGIATSLQRLGLGQLLQTYLRGLSSTMPVAHAQLHEFEYEAAWRQCQWDSPPSFEGAHRSTTGGFGGGLGDAGSTHSSGGIGGADSGSGGSDSGGHFHEGVFRCLTALVQRDQPLFERQLAKTRFLVAQAGAQFSGGSGGSGLGGERSKGVYTMLARLQMLVELEEGWGLANVLHHTSTHTHDEDGGGGARVSMGEAEALPGGRQRLATAGPSMPTLAITQSQIQSQFTPFAPVGLGLGTSSTGLGSSSSYSTNNHSSSSSVLARWHRRLLSLQDHFELAEPILSLRIAILSICGGSSSGGVGGNGGVGTAGGLNIPSTAATTTASLALANHLCTATKLARHANHTAAAMGGLHRLKAHLTTGLHIGTGPNAEAVQLQLQLQWRLEEAKVLWSQGDQDTALHMATELETALKTKMVLGRSSASGVTGSGSDALYNKGLVSIEQMRARVLRLCGKWMASTRSHCSQGVLDNYLRASANLLQGQLQQVDEQEHEGQGAGGKSGKEGKRGRQGMRHLAKANMVLADYVAGLYENVKARVSSEEWSAGKQVAADREQELTQCEAALREQRKQQHGGSKDAQAEHAERDKTLARHTTVLRRECVQDAQERRRVEQSVQEFLIEALEQYGLALTYANTSDDFRAVFRLLSLWFNNSGLEQVNRTMYDHSSGEGLVTQIPSQKFVPLIYQIASRLGTSTASADSSGGSRSSTPVDGGSRSSTPVVMMVSDDVGFQRALRKLLGRLASDHPHHSIPQLLAFKNGEKVSGRGAEDYKLNVGDDKIEAAKEEIEAVKKR